MTLAAEIISHLVEDRHLWPCEIASQIQRCQQYKEQITMQILFAWYSNSPFIQVDQSVRHSSMLWCRELLAAPEEERFLVNCASQVSSHIAAMGWLLCCDGMVAALALNTSRHERLKRAGVWEGGKVGRSGRTCDHHKLPWGFDDGQNRQVNFLYDLQGSFEIFQEVFSDLIQIVHSQSHNTRLKEPLVKQANWQSFLERRICTTAMAYGHAEIQCFPGIEGKL